jgi:glycosyltransferase involved in cell wall biosynthesis
MLIEQQQDKTAAIAPTPPPSSVALLPWGDVWDDFLDSIGVSMETFCTDGPGGWLLGYIESLRLVGIRTVLILISARVTEPQRFQHTPTGTTIRVIPAPKSYRAIRRQLANPNPYLAKSFEDMTGDAKGNRRRLLKALYLVAPYLATPLGLVAQEIRREGCRAILCQDYESSRFDVCTLLGKLMGLPVFASFQSGCFDPNRIGRWLRPFTIRTCDGLVIGPQTEIQRVRDRYNLQPGKIAQIFNPIDLKLWNAIDRHEARATLGLPVDAHVVVWHGRIEMNTKRLDILLDAWASICAEQTGRELRLLLLGTGQDAEALHSRIAALPLQNVVWINKYTTDRSEIRCILSAGDLYAFPSVFEGFPVAPIEAMACGLPLVAAAASGVPDILKHGEASGGLLVPCGDVVAFTSALRRILDDPAWASELGKLARRRVEEAFSLEAVGQQFLNFFVEHHRSTHKN